MHPRSFRHSKHMRRGRHAAAALRVPQSEDNIHGTYGQTESAPYNSAAHGPSRRPHDENHTPCDARVTWAYATLPPPARVRAGGAC